MDPSFTFYLQYPSPVRLEAQFAACALLGLTSAATSPSSSSAPEEEGDLALLGFQRATVPNQEAPPRSPTELYQLGVDCRRRGGMLLKKVQWELQNHKTAGDERSCQEGGQSQSGPNKGGSGDGHEGLSSFSPQIWFPMPVQSVESESPFSMTVSTGLGFGSLASMPTDKAHQTAQFPPLSVLPDVPASCPSLSIASIQASPLLQNSGLSSRRDISKAAMDLQLPLSTETTKKPTSQGEKELSPVPSTDFSDEDYRPAPQLVKIPCRLMLSMMLEELGLPDARYSSHTHEDGEVSAIVTFWAPAEIPGNLLQQLKIGGALADSPEDAEDSAAKEGTIHIEVSQNIEIEDLHYSELTCVMKRFKSLLYKSSKERRKKQSLQKELTLAGKTMLKCSRKMSGLVCGKYSVLQGSEAESYNEALEQFEKVATDLSKASREVARKLKAEKKL